MKRFDILTIFPEILDSYFNESILRRAREKKIIEIKAHNIRQFAKDKHHTTDDKPFGGGPGMVVKARPIIGALKEIKKYQNKKIKMP